MVLECPKCGGDMVFEGYRPLFPTCDDCGESFYIDDCVKE